MAQDYIDISSNSITFYSSSNSFSGGSNKYLNFRSILHLYYSNFNTGSGIIETTGSYDNYLETSLFYGSRKVRRSGEGMVYSIPQNLYGTHIEPGSLVISSSFYSGYHTDLILTDDGEGNIVDSLNGNDHVGNIIYSHGQLIITTFSYYIHLSASEAADIRPKISFKSNLPLHTNTYSIKIADYEFNHTLNPTAQTTPTLLSYSGSTYVQPSGVYANNITGSDFQPYITTVGLYNDSNELLIVGKLAQPLPKPANTELTIHLKLDL